VFFFLCKSRVTLLCKNHNKKKRQNVFYVLTQWEENVTIKWRLVNSENSLQGIFAVSSTCAWRLAKIAQLYSKYNYYAFKILELLRNLCSWSANANNKKSWVFDFFVLPKIFFFWFFPFVSSLLCFLLISSWKYKNSSKRQVLRTFAAFRPTFYVTNGRI